MAGGWFTVSYTVVERLHLFLFCQKFTSPPEDTLIPRGLNRLRRELFPSLFFFFLEERLAPREKSGWTLAEFRKPWWRARFQGKPGSKPVHHRPAMDRNIRPVPLESRRELHVLQQPSLVRGPRHPSFSLTLPTPPRPRFTIEILLGDFPAKIQPRAWSH